MDSPQPATSLIFEHGTSGWASMTDAGTLRAASPMTARF